MAAKTHRKITINYIGDEGLNLDVLAEVLVTRYLMDCMAATKEKAGGERAPKIKNKRTADITATINS